MTQQYDLTFNTTNTMDKMMTQSQSKSSSSSSYADADKFDNFLSTANKSYTQENNRSDKSQAQTQAKSNTHQETNKKQSNSTVSDNKTGYKESAKTEESSNVLADEKTVTNQKETDNNDVKKAVVDEIVNDTLNNDNVISDNNEVDVKEMMLVSNAQLSNIEVTPKDISNLEKSFAMSDVPVDDEIPAEAIKSGINLETLSKAIDTSVEDTTDVDMQVVDNAIKDTIVAKDDAISAMYKANVSTDNKVVNNNNDVKINLAKKEEVQDVKLETVVQNVKTEELPTVDEKINQPKLENDNEKVVVDKAAGLKEDVKAFDNVAKEVDVKVELNVDVKNDEKVETAEVKVDNKLEDVKTVDDLDKIQVVKELKSDKDDLKATKEVQDDVKVLAKDVQDKVVHNVKAINLNEVEDEKTQKVETLVDNTATDKLNELKEEVQSAKAENIFETLSTQDEKVSNNDKKVADKFAKTNVESDETMEIEDDTKGIEFVSKKSDKVVDKTAVQDKQVSNVKEKVENVKIQVEDNVKVAINQNQDSAKTEKANETMTKAGLTTKTLREMDGKVTSMETGNQTGAQFGETSQEMLMRDMLSQDATVQTSEAKTTVDFTQSLNKATTAQQPQPQQNTQDAQEVNILDQIRAKFAVSKQNGLQKITIGLTPESLGKVTVEIVKGQNGISANLLAENPQAKEILDKNLDGLKSVLQTQGVNVNNVNVKVAEAGRSSENNNNMFQSDDGQFNQESGGEHSKENNSSNHEKHSGYDFMNNNSMGSENAEQEEVISNTVQMEKTVSIKGGNGKISYKL